jgi:hypothetical protein
MAAQKVGRTAVKSVGWMVETLVDLSDILLVALTVPGMVERLESKLGD